MNRGRQARNHAARKIKAHPGLAKSTRPRAAPRIRLLLVDDHPVVREGLRSCLSRLRHLAIVGEAASGEEALRQAVRLKPDLVLMDINLPGISGLAAAAQLRRLVPGARVLMLSVQASHEYVAEVARSGARGYLLKDSSPDELVRAIEAVRRGEVFFSPSVASKMLATLDTSLAAPSPANAARLTQRERDVVALIASGASSKIISERLGIAVSTVKTLRERIMRKLDLHSVAALTHFAVTQGLATLPQTRSRV